ncbi:MAG: nucleotidyltransferase domain-containing protein [Oscillospiraceae bacterium]|nr:nucleotidyltransferase domain-containing protein [Candidatus Equicaccousia limihippi]
MSDKIYSIEEIKNIVTPIAQKYGVDKIYLFGSYARGQATADSDLDFRVDRGALRGLLALGGMYSDLEEKFGKKLDLLTTASLDEVFLNRIKNEEVLVYAG